jgi:hypothetical protein
MQRSRVVLAHLILVLAACGTKASTAYGPGATSPGGDDASLSDDDSGAGGSFGSGDGGGVFQGTGSLDAATTTYVAESGVSVTLIDTCATSAPSGLSATAEASLLAGGSAGSLRFLYPYASTVFPRGLIAPTLMWDGATADYVYVHLKSSTFEYKGCLAPTATGQVLLPQNVWVAASSGTSGAANPFTLSLTTISGSTVTGPVSEPLIIAAATLAGSVYYNSYTTSLSNGSGGAVLRIVPGQNATLFLGSSGCTACHAVSANGSRMVADPYNAFNNGAGSSYALTPNIGPNPTALSTTVPNGTFVGMYPDGTMYLGNAHPNDGLGGPRAGSPGYAGPVNAGLFDTDTGTAITNTNIPTTAMTPMFSPDGTRLAFNDYAIASGGGLATMSFSKTGPSASNYKQVFQVTDTSTYPGWPFFLPDNGGLIFAIGNQADFSGGGIGLGLMGGVATATSDLSILDLASDSSTILGEAVGFTSAANAASNTTYLPYGTADLHHNFYPTVSPVAAGGYFWVFFDSYRNYGNNGLQRQLYGTAVDVSATGHYTTDPSHPPFYVTGQELGTGNHRAFTALDPCLANGSSCTSGFDCCAGFCTDGTCGMPAQPRCSNTGEACSATQKCCITADECIAGYCATVTSQ